MSRPGSLNKRWEKDPAGYARLQEEQKRAKEEGEQERKDEAEYRDFQRAYLRRIAGAQDSEIREMFERYRREQAVAEAAQATEATAQQMRQARSRQV